MQRAIFNLAVALAVAIVVVVLLFTSGTIPWPFGGGHPVGGDDFPDYGDGEEPFVEAPTPGARQPTPSAPQYDYTIPVPPLACSVRCAPEGKYRAVLDVNWTVDVGRDVRSLAIAAGPTGFHDYSYGRIDLNDVANRSGASCLKRFDLRTQLDAAVRECGKPLTKVLDGERLRRDATPEDMTNGFGALYPIRVITKEQNEYEQPARMHVMLTGVVEHGAYGVGLYNTDALNAPPKEQIMCIIPACRREEGD